MQNRYSYSNKPLVQHKKQLKHILCMYNVYINFNVIKKHYLNALILFTVKALIKYGLGNVVKSVIFSI